ncbi:methyltransferase Fkbm family [Seminavis robusta]|uniref:Methyltransferase Fkbm family n=1 Tax=Seminavis robusta TaxID=568900 RepID=A0A9N8HV96_9STRA|nr:methyltransferase Fkbm family [Seminavis robusta]|eukprot:Sro1480_g276130.1 methyltransferase Fkbm family (334) ;mRNA; f:2705-3706
MDRLFIVLVLLLAPHVVQGIYPQGLLMQLKLTYPEWAPNAVVDIGANIGAWAHRVRVNYPDAKILMLEATPNHRQRLEQRCEELGPQATEFKIAVLSGTTGDTVEFFQDGNTGNSFLRENSQHYSNSKPVSRTTSRLDDIIQESFLKSEEYIDFIKADVQGAELMVLEGAEETLAKATFVQLESGIIEYNQGGACFYEIDAFLRSKGFYWYEMSDITRRREYGTLGLGQFDVLYVNPSSPRLPQAFKQLNGQYCGMNSNRQPNNSGPVLSSRLTALLDTYGLLELEQAMEAISVVPSGTWSRLVISFVMVCLAFFAGVLYGVKKAHKTLRCTQ